MRKKIQMKKHLGIAVLAMAVFLFLPLAAHADVVWNFFGPQSPFPNPVTSPAVDVPGPYPLSVTSGGFTLLLTPLAPGVPVLTGRNLGPGLDEQGAGIRSLTIPINASDSTTFEVNGAEALRIDLPAGLSNFQVRFNSLAPAEVAQLWAGSIGGINLGTVTHNPGAPFEFLPIPDADKSLPIFVQASAGDVLVYGVAAVPEPATLLLLGLGLLGVGIQRRRAKN